MLDHDFLCPPSKKYTTLIGGEGGGIIGWGNLQAL